MFQKRNLSLVALFIVGLLLTACGGGAPNVDWTVSITGEVGTPIDVSYADLAEMNHIDLKDVLMQKSQGEDTTNSWEGPSLAAIFDEAGVSLSAKTITATAADGYAMEMNMADLGDAIVALKRDGEWTTSEKNGPIRIVVPGKPANHWLFQLVEIEVVE